jgi:tRNA U34 5-methylaminomethyl-2-thiouridine-forming methyltransferase MnmC
LLTFYETAKQNKAVFYHAIELYPIEIELAKQLNYPEILNIKNDLFLDFHKYDWEKAFSITDNFILLKTNRDITSLELSLNYDLVYYDAFAPNKQEEIWNKNIIRKIFSSMNTDGILVTYTTNGEVKRAMKDCGFIVEKLPGPTGKRHILRAAKK